jgi:hypothetical protein
VLGRSGDALVSRGAIARALRKAARRAHIAKLASAYILLIAADWS